MSLQQSYLDKFLASPMVSEAVDPADREDGLVDGFNIPLDAQARALSSKVKLPLAKRLVALFTMAGVPGRYLNAEDAEGTIMAAADMLRKKATVRKAFIDFYDRLAIAQGYSAPSVTESKRRIKESDGEVAKRGNYINKMFTTILIELGLPETLAGVTAPAAVQAGLLRVATMIDQDSSLDRTMRTLALRMGIKSEDIRAGVSESRGVKEAVEVGQDDFANEVIALVTALGIPEEILNLRRPQLVKALRTRKQTLKNRATIQTMMGRLNALITNNTQQGANTED